MRDEFLVDKRGIRKKLQNLSPEEILKRENKELQDKNRRLEAKFLLILGRVWSKLAPLISKFKAIKKVSYKNKFSVTSLCNILNIADHITKGCKEIFLIEKLKTKF